MIRVIIIGVLVSMISCKVNQALVEDLNSKIQRLQADSATFERKIRQLNEENAYLSEKCAVIEQTLTFRLQEKEDSLRLKEQMLQERELNLNEMKLRKEQEAEAFNQLSQSIFSAFSAYPDNIKLTRTTCSEIIIEFSERALFSTQITKSDSLRGSVLKQVARVIKRNPDLKITLMVTTDSLFVVKEKNEDAWSWSASRANILARELIKDYQIPSHLITTSAGIDSNEKSSTRLGKNRVQFIFQSVYLPCIHID